MLFRGISSRKRHLPSNGALIPDLQAIQGTWETVASIEKGTTYKLPPIVTFVFEGDKIATFLEGKEQHKGTVKLNTATDPPTIELDLKGEALGNEDQYTFGIYKLEDDKLTICAGVESAANKKPTTFAHSKAFPTASTVLERKREAEKAVRQEAPADATDNNAVARLKQLGANVGPTGKNAVPTPITIDLEWHGTPADLKALEDVPSLRAVL